MAQLERTAAAEFLSDEDLALVTAPEGAGRLGLSASTIRSWKRREWLQVQAWTAAGEPLFSYRELVEFEYLLRTTGRARPLDA